MEALKLVGPTVATEPEPKRLDLGCGARPKEGFEGVDLYSAEATHKVNLFKFPFPWSDASVDEIHCSHFVEHLPAREVEERDLLDELQAPKFLGQDFFFAFFDECYRILKPGSKMLVIVPHLKCDGAFQDPTHRRFINQQTFNYLSKTCRDIMQLGHYRVLADFDNVTIPVGPAEFGLLHPEAQARRFAESWNVIFELHATLTAKK
jgi:predicted SAM-dependent methyltransferase